MGIVIFAWLILLSIASAGTIWVAMKTDFGLNARLMCLELDMLVPASVEVLSGRLTRSTEDAACWDVHSNEEVFIPPNTHIAVGTGIKTIMDNCDAFLWDRSGLAAKFGVTRRAGVIDEKYPEEWKVVLRNEGWEPFIVRKGDRVAQAHFVPKFNVPVRGDGVTTSDTVRTNGFGSTGQ